MENIPNEEVSILNSNPQDNFVKKPNNKFLWLLVIFLVLVAGFFSYNAISGNQSTKNKTSQDSSSTINQPLTTHLLASIPEDFSTRFGYHEEENFVFDGVGNTVMYPAKHNSTSTIVLMSNNEAIGDFFQLLHLSKSKDGTRVNYAGLKIVDKKDNVPTVDFVVNGVSQLVGFPLSGTSIGFSADGSHYSYVVYTKERQRVLIYDGKPLYIAGEDKEQRSGYTAHSPVFNSDDSRIMITTEGASKPKVAIINTNTKEVKEDPEFDAIFNSVFSPDGKHYAYRARNNEKEIIVVDGVIVKTLTAYSGVAWAPEFSLDNTKVSFAVDKKVKNAIQIDTKKEIPYEADDFQSQSAINMQSEEDDGLTSLKTFDSSGKNWVRYGFDLDASEQAKEERFFVEINGKKVDKLFRYVSEPQFAVSDTHVTFGAREGNQLKWFVYEITEQGFVQR